MVLRPQKIAITGCGGMLGEAVAAIFQKGTIYASDVNLNESWLDRLDVSSSRHVHKYLSAIEPDCIIHLAALTDMEFCEDHSGEAYATWSGKSETGRGRSSLSTTNSDRHVIRMTWRVA